VTITDSEPTVATELAIPEGLCGIGGCVFIDGHESRGNPRHTWQT